MELQLSSQRVLRLVQGDITQIAADAIANAANSALAGGGGVDGAIHRAGGPSIMAELDVIRRQQGGCPTGSAVVTSAGKLPARYVFHAVGPIYRDGRHGEPELLANCYRTCLRSADEGDVRTITFPSISTGVYGYPVTAAASVALTTVSHHLRTETTTVEQAIFVLFDTRTLTAYTDALQQLATLGEIRD